MNEIGRLKANHQLDPAYPDPNDNELGYQGPLQCGGAPKSNVISVSYGQIEVSQADEICHPQAPIELKKC
jgi:hypothetical protein